MMVHPLLPELIALQRREGYLPDAALQELGERLHVPLNHIYSVATFYQAFRFTPGGKHQLKVCIGAACYVKGAETLYQAFADHLKIPPGADTSPDGLFTLSKVACLGCCMLAVAVQIDRHIFGHVTPDIIPALLRDFLRMANEEDEAQEHQGTSSAGGAEIRVCRCSSCRAAGSGRVYRELAREGAANGFEFTVKEVGCHGMSYRAPLVTIALPDAVWHYDQVREHEVKAILANHFIPGKLLRKLSWKSKVALETFYRRKQCACAETGIEDSAHPRLITRNSGITHPESLTEYRANGGFAAFEKATTMQPDEIVACLANAKLRGRGGGGYPTGEKWSQALTAPGPVKVVVCNADEGDPGAFMDRMLLESYPYRVLEGILIAALTIRASCAIIYIREEYTQAVAVLEKVIARLKESDILSALPPGFELTLFRGAGAFVCGEETALLESLQGNRGIPRKRPPFPVTNGLNGVPTLMNNVETFACIPVILADNGAAFNAVGTELSHGTKAFALAGKVRQGGLIEVPIGISISDIVERFGNGAEEGQTLKAVMIGGPSGGCIPRKRFDLPVDYESLRQNGAMMGSGGLVVLDERDCMVDLSLYFLRFLRDESCGKCVMCREGVGRLCGLVESLTKNESKDAKLLDNIESLARHIQQGALCALGRTAPNMVLSALHEFRHEFEAHLDNDCPAGKCTELTNFQVSGDCIGCTRCAQVCAADAIVCEPLERAEIISEKCVKCGVCRTVCPRQAIVNPCRPIAEKESPPLVEHSGTTLPGEVISIDGQSYPFKPGWRLLDYAEAYQFDLPTLCYLKGINEDAHCMVCAVWDDTIGRFLPGCEHEVQRGHIYDTKSDRVRAFRREALSLMLFRHDFRCGTCTAKGACRFFDLVHEYGAKKTKNTLTFPPKIQTGTLTYESGKCILCHRCIGASRQLLTIHNRAERSIVTPAPASWDIIPPDLVETLCTLCPTGALSRLLLEERSP